MPREKHPIHLVAKKAGQLNKVMLAIMKEERPSRDARRSTSFIWRDLAKATSQLSSLVVQTGDIEERRFGPGQVLLLDDTTGEGHLSTFSHDEPCKCLVVQIGD